MSDLSLTLFCFSCVSFSIVPCCYGQVSGVKVWLAKRYQGIKILKETERKKKNWIWDINYCKFSKTIYLTYREKQAFT